jgi:hypothetical protein
MADPMLAALAVLLPVLVLALLELLPLPDCPANALDAWPVL